MRYHSKFTIIELLVVIAIIMILASILFPALKQAKETSKRIVCTGNLKQIASALMSYAGNHDETIFNGRFQNWDKSHSFKGITWPNLLGPYLGYGGNYLDTHDNINDKRHQNQVFFCPSGNSRPYKVNRYRLYFTYGMNCFQSSYTTPPVFPRLSRLKTPTKTFVFADFYSPKYAGDVAAGQYLFKRYEAGSSIMGHDFDSPHQNGTNLLFLDTHTEWKSYRHEVQPTNFHPNRIGHDFWDPYPDY